MKWILLLTALAACTSTSIDVKTSTSPDANFTGYETYAWGERPELDEGIDADFLDRTVKAEVDRELTARGFRRIESGEADFIVNYTAVLQRKVTRAESDDETTAGYYEHERKRRLPELSRGTGEDKQVHEYTEGKLILDMLDPVAQVPLWRGKATDEVFAKDVKLKRRQRIVLTVRKLFKDFPR